MKNLRLQPGCHDCQHCFVKTDHDGEYQLYCNIDGGRPLCGSVLLEEIFPGLNDLDDPDRDAKYLAALETWEAWSDPRKVQPAHICDLYEPKED